MSTIEQQKLQLAEKRIEEKQELKDLQEMVWKDFLIDQIHTEGFLDGLSDTFLGKMSAKVAKNIAPQIGILSEEKITDIEKMIEKYKKTLNKLSEKEVQQMLHKETTSTKPEDIQNTPTEKPKPAETLITPSIETHEIPCDTTPLEEAKKYLGTKEWTGEADKFLKPFMGKNADATQTPRCAGFVSYCLRKTGHEVSHNPVWAKSYINQIGPGHIAFWSQEEGKMIAGNYGNKVAYQELPQHFKRNTPEEIDKGNFDGFDATDPKNIPDGAIIIMNRSWSDMAMA